MGLTYFKRYRMDFDLAKLAPPVTGLPGTYRLIPWRASLRDAHADTKYRSFRFEIDANVFPCLGDREGCRRLMDEITGRKGFLREATWLAAYQASLADPLEYCGTIQGIRDGNGVGSIQNVGITPEHRGIGLGTHLLYSALSGFASLSLRRATLEVTAQNCGAYRLYRRYGFQTVKTVYKAVEVAYA